MNNSSSYVTSSIGRFFHLMRYLVIDLFHSYLIFVSRIVSSYSMIFPYSIILGKIV
jgi:hypothetical protein